MICYGVKVKRLNGSRVLYLEAFDGSLSVEEGSAICAGTHQVAKALTQVSHVPVGRMGGH